MFAYTVEFAYNNVQWRRKFIGMPFIYYNRDAKNPKRRRNLFGRTKILRGKRAGVRRDTLLLGYRPYTRPVMEFDCGLFFNGPIYKLRLLYLLDCTIRRLSVFLPLFGSERVLYLEERVPELMVGFLFFTVRIYLFIFEATPPPHVAPNAVFICALRQYFTSPCRKVISTKLNSSKDGVIAFFFMMKLSQYAL